MAYAGEKLEMRRPDPKMGETNNLVDGQFPGRILRLSHAGVAQLVEHHLAKVDVESSSLFARSILMETPVSQVVTGVFCSQKWRKS